MASNFQIFAHETRDSLHLKLYGDFDGSSAYELLHALEHNAGFDQIFIDINDIESIYPFGRDLFQKKLGTIKKEIGNLFFIGELEHSFLPY